jgi:PAS domain S-box-containing protein
MAIPSAAFNEEALLAAIMEGTASATGDDFFRALVSHLSRALETHGAWVTEYLPESNTLKALAFWLGGRYIENYEYPVAGTPCADTIGKKSYLHIPDRVVDLFPGDPDLRRIGAVSYFGVPLLDPRGEVLGNLAVLDTRPMPASFRSTALFKIFSARATAELLRMRAEAESRAREEKLEGLFHGAIDAIIELNADLSITRLNPAAERLLAVSGKEASGRPFAAFLSPADMGGLRELVDRLAREPGGRQSAWVAEGLTVNAGQGPETPAEATLTRLEIRGESCFALILRDINERQESRRHIEALRDEIQVLSDAGQIVGTSPALRRTLQLAAEVAPTDAAVIIYGETGTGKELVARAIHAASLRSERPMITVNCAAIPETLIESEFFGHEKGAFTGATQRREGRFALADRGSIFLDEVGELNPEMQAKLLRVLQEGEFAPVGSSRNRRVNVRVIAATNRDLSLLVQEGRFRPDLYFRLSVFPISIPPLRERVEDIEPLAVYLAAKIGRRMGRAIEPPAPDLIARLNSYRWPGNVRELQNVIERGVITARNGRLNLDYALPHVDPSPPPLKTRGPARPRPAVKTLSEFKHLERGKPAAGDANRQMAHFRPTRSGPSIGRAAFDPAIQAESPGNPAAALGHLRGPPLGLHARSSGLRFQPIDELSVLSPAKSRHCRNLVISERPAFKMTTHRFIY